MSLLVTAVFVYLVPLVPAWLYSKGVYSLDLFFMLFVAVMYLALQALILFGFPLYYAQDKKSHMTGFRILLYALGWEVVLMALVTVLMVALSEPQYNYDILDDIDWEALQGEMDDTSVDADINVDVAE